MPEQHLSVSPEAQQFVAAVRDALATAAEQGLPIQGLAMMLIGVAKNLTDHIHDEAPDQPTWAELLQELLTREAVPAYRPEMAWPGSKSTGPQ